jgi:hypothetical protein
MLYKLSGSTFTHSQDFNVSDAPSSMLVAGDCLCLASRRAFSMLQMGSGVQTDVLSGGEGLAGMALLPSGEVLLTRDTSTYFFAPEGGCSLGALAQAAVQGRLCSGAARALLLRLLLRLRLRRRSSCAPPGVRGPGAEAASQPAAPPPLLPPPQRPASCRARRCCSGAPRRWRCWRGSTTRWH